MTDPHDLHDRQSEGNVFRPIDLWLGKYSEDHRHPVNIFIHWICVPIILCSVIAALWTLPVPQVLGRPGLWAGVGMFLALMFYQRLSRRLMFGMLAAFAACGAIAELGYRFIGPHALLLLAAALFVVAWILQFLGHRIEGRRPSFLTDIAYLLIGPAWLVTKIMRRLGIPI